MMDGYAPFPLETDDAAAGLATTVSSRGGATAVARHLPVRTSSRGTLFLHGAAGSWTTWTPLIAAAREAGTDLGEPVLFDLPGWGDAEADGNVTVAIICDLVKDLALDLGYTEWDIVGHSMGGFIALHMAALWPSSVTSVRMVSGTSHSVIDAVDRPWRGLRVIPGFVLFRAAMIAFSHVDRPVRALVRFLSRAHLLLPFVTPLFRHTLRVDSSVVRALGTELRPRSFVAATSVARGYDADALWSGIRCPVLATMGDRDVFVTSRDLSELRRIVPGARTTVIADCGHFGNVERPREVLAALFG